MAQELKSPPEATPATIQDGLSGRRETDATSAGDDAAVFTTATYVAQAIQFVAGLIQKGVLGPVGAGYWALMQSIWQYFPVVTLGSSAGGARQIPIRRGRGDFGGAALVADTGATFAILAMGAGGLIVAMVAAAFGGSWAPELRWGLVILGLTAPVRMLTNAHEMVITATRRFRAVAAADVLRAAVALTVQTAAVIAFGFWGMFVGAIAAALAVLVLWARMGLTGRRRPAFRWRYDRSALRELIAYGAPLLVWGQLWLLFIGIDSILVAAILDVESLGFYALAVSLTSYLLHMPRSIGSVLAPRMAETFGQTDDIASLREYAVGAQRLLSHLLVPAFLAAAFFAGPVLIRHALPDFTPAIPIVRIMAAGSFFIALTNMPVKTMITAGRRAPLIGLIIPCLAVNVGGNYLAMAVLDAGIEGAAVATSISYLLVFALTGSYGLSQMIGRSATTWHLIELVAAAAYTIAVVWGIELVVGGSEAFFGDVALAALKLALAMVALAPWFIRSQQLDRGPERIAGLLRRGVAASRRSPPAAGS